ncbi:MAG: hypothetical protein LBS29_04560 [Endomicrobium sp.]|jgi:hypothetical protein|nr:hypothetical protein [Endomicrobium sp.]
MENNPVHDDILYNPRFQGAIDQLGNVVEVVDWFFVIVLSGTAFFIIMTAMLKNVLAGAYCAFPKFWDKVDAAHKESEQQGFIGAIKADFQNVQGIHMGTISKTVMRLLPNIKTLTDFDDYAKPAKQYWITAIPQMILAVIIGAFIYNGYYRDVAMKVVDAGSTIFTRTLLAADPVAMFDRITGSIGRPTFMTASAVEPYDKFINSVAEEAYNRIIATYPDIRDAGQSHVDTVAQGIETWLMECFKGEFETYADSSGWEPTIVASLALGKPDLTYQHRRTSTNGNIFQVAFAKALEDFSLKTTINPGQDWWLRVVVTFTKVVSSEETIQPKTLVASIPTSAVVPSTSSTLSSARTTTIKFSEIEATGGVDNDNGSGFVTSNSVTIYAQDDVVVKGTFSDGDLTFPGDVATKFTGKCPVRGLIYSSGGQLHTVETILFGETVNELTFESKDGKLKFTYKEGISTSIKEDSTSDSTEAGKD